MDVNDRKKLQRLRDRRNAEREGWYRSFESGIAKPLVRSHHCVRLDDSLTDRIAGWPASVKEEADSAEFETSDLNRNGWLASARDLLTASSEPLFIVLSRPGAPYMGAICGKDAVIDILEEVLDREEGIIVLCPSAPDGFHFDVSNNDNSSHGEFCVAAWGAMATALIDHVQTMTGSWRTIPKS